MAGRKSTLDKNLVIELYKAGHTYRAIAEKLSSNEDAIRMLIKRNAPEKIVEKKNARQVKKSKPANSDIDFIVEHTNKLNAAARTEIRNASRYGLNPNEGKISDLSFVKLFRQSYICDKNTGVLHFDKTRGGVTKDLPRRYEADIKNTYNCNCLAIIPGGANITKEFIIKAYDSFDAEVRARKRINNLISSEFTIVK